MISEAKLREIELLAEMGSKSPYDCGKFNQTYGPITALALTKALREATAVMRIVSNRHRVSCVCEACEWMREWRGESDKQGEA